MSTSSMFPFSNLNLEMIGLRTSFGNFLLLTDSMESGISRLLSFFTYVKQIITCLNKVLVLHFSENTEPFGQTINGVNNSCGVFGELLPRDIRLGASFLENSGEILFDGLEIDGHICEISVNKKFNK